MADDNYIDPSDDSLVPPWNLPIAQNSVTGIRRVQTPDSLGVWDGADVSGVGFVPGLAGTKKVLSGAGKRVGKALENLTADPYLAPDEAKNQPPPTLPSLAPDETKNQPPAPQSGMTAQAPVPFATPGGPIDPLQARADARGARPPEAPPLETDSSGGKPGAQLDLTPHGTGGRSDPSPAYQDQSQDVLGNSILGKNLLNGFRNWTDQHRMTLMAMAGGLAGPHSGVGRMFSAGANTLPEQQKLNENNATANYFMQSGMPRNEAMAMAGNPALTQEALGQMSGYAPPKTLTMKDWMQNEHAYQYDPKSKTWNPLNVGGGVPATGGAPGSNLGTTLSPEQWDAASPDERVNSLTDPNMKGLATSLRHGGNIAGRQQLTAANTLMAQIDPNWNQVTSYDAAKTMAQDLQKSSPSSTGGLLANGFSAFGHLGELGDAMVGVGAYNGPDILGGGMIGQIGNYGRSMAATPELKGARSQEADNAIKYGEEGTKFYAATGGGEAERMAALNNATGDGKLSIEKAGYLRSELGLMQRRMEDKLAQVQASPGSFDWMQKNGGRIQQMAQDVARVKHAIAQLDPNGPEAQAERQQQGGAPQTQAQNAPRTQTPPATQGIPAAGGGAVVRQNGHLYKQQPDGSWQLVQ